MNNNKSSGIYSIVDFPKDGQNYGNFEGRYPKSAALKSFSFLMNFMNKENNGNLTGKFIVFVIKENSTNKLHKYIGSRVKLYKPILIRKNNKDINYIYKDVVGKYNKELDKI